MLSGKYMPKPPKGHKRPASVISTAVTVTEIATGEIDATLNEDGKNRAAVALGRMGGQARAEALSPKRRRAIAKQAALARHRKSRG
jgi:hypothetical protein